MSRRFPRTPVTVAVLAAGLLIGWNAPFSLAQQSPDTWSGEQRAVLPSGLSVELEFAAVPGVAVTAGAGELADRAGGGRSAGLYADGMHPGEPAQTFRATEDRPQADGSWRTLGTLRLTFSRPVRNPRLHLSGLAATATGKSGTTSTAARLTLTGGSPAAPVLVNRTDFPGWTVDANTLGPAGADGASDGSGGAAAEGSVELVGTFRTAVFRVEQRSTARAGSTTAAPVLTQAYTVTVDEDLGTAPQGYGNASHVLSDLFLGADAANPSHRARAGSAGAAGDGPLVRLDRGAGRRSVFASPVPPKLQPGRGEYQGADPSVSYPAEAAIGRYYRLTVPVAVDDQPATLAGWIDFDHNGRFDPAERVQTEVPAGADTATLEWTVPTGAASGETWARLRIAREAGQLIAPGGFADSGQVSDQRIKLTVGAARPEIAEPVDGAVLADARPTIRGEGAIAGATVEIRDGDTALCRARVERGGAWSCRPGAALAAGPHGLTPVETTSGGVVLRGEAVRVTVKTAPPAVPVLTLPEYTNDPGLQLTGTGEPGSTVSVVDQPAGARGADAAAGRAELCSTAVRADGEWSCLPVENLADGRHQLTPSAVDAAGNRASGKAVTLVVDTAPPDRPVLVSPAAGETLRVARPRLAGRAEPGAKVLVTARTGESASAERTVLCGATVAFDGSWSCTANRDLGNGEQWLVVTATDLAGNGTAAEAVVVRVAVPGGAATASGAASATATASGAATSSPAVTPSASGVASAGAAASPSAAVSAAPSASRPSASGSPAASVTASPSASAVPSASPSPSLSPSAASASATAAAAPSPAVPSAPEVVVFAPVPAGLLPIVVPPVPPAPLVPSAPAGVVRTVGASPATSAVSAPPTPGVSPSGAAVGVTVAPSVAPSSAPVVEPTASARAAARPRPVPPAVTPPGAADAAGEASSAAAERPASSGWRGGLAGVLLLLTAIGLITRRVFAPGHGARRR
ncbi:Ig-like domain-containing protein [Kitasatospora sp. NPDC097643]|uniref:Ig-like domain-containing protein n=1 Tax=Kitasatospora sp. NPDC097643 TaxID=3157230 RepID=UPI00332ACD44